MTSTVDISIYQLSLFLILIIIPVGLFKYLQLKLIKELFISVARMIIQLFLIGAYLEFIFKLNNPAVNFLWILMMIAVANFSVIRYYFQCTICNSTWRDGFRKYIKIQCNRIR